MNLSQVMSNHIRLNSSINRSPSKVTYSFSKAERFKRNKTDNYYVFYNIPDTKSNRSCSMGYGKKIDFTKRAKGQCISLYSFPSLFDPKYHNSPQYSFGSRYPKDKTRNITPGPKYNVGGPFGNDAPSFSLGEKLSKKNVNRSFISPGPGAYYNPRNHVVGKYYESRFKNAAMVSIGGSAKRFNYSVERIPGPGQYKVPSLINESGQIYESKYKSIPARSFIGSKISLSQRDKIPGPGAYDSFSEFEGYELNHK